MQLTPEKDTECVLVDTGMFHLVEFANTLCLPYVGSAVHGGIHMLQLCPRKLSPRMLMVKKLDATRKVSPPVVQAVRETAAFCTGSESLWQAIVAASGVRPQRLQLGVEIGQAWLLL